jgi:hypothetical protein
LKKWISSLNCIERSWKDVFLKIEIFFSRSNLFNWSNQDLRRENRSIKRKINFLIIVLIKEIFRNIEKKNSHVKKSSIFLFQRIFDELIWRKMLLKWKSNGWNLHKLVR